MKRFFQVVEKNGDVKKRVCETSAEVDDHQGKQSTRDPTKFLSWNANSFLLRVKNNRDELFELIRRINPDVIAIQEVRIPAAGPKGGFKRQSIMKEDTSSAKQDKQTMMHALRQAPLADYEAVWSLADSKYGGTALLIKHCCKPISVGFSLDVPPSQDKHEVDGRVIIAEFDTFKLLNTYVPNNGWKDEDSGFQRRRQWDERMLKFVSNLSGKPLLWCGDLNVSHEHMDVSHPEFFQNAKLNGYTPPVQEDCGQPGFTPAERRRFSQCLSDGCLVDSYRWLHKEQDFDNGFTWSGNPVGKYRGKRMRIDYFLISKQLVGRLLHSDIHGSGIELQGFCGSDHCPITMELSPASSET